MTQKFAHKKRKEKNRKISVLLKHYSYSKSPFFGNSIFYQFQFCPYNCSWSTAFIQLSQNWHLVGLRDRPYWLKLNIHDKN